MSAVNVLSQLGRRAIPHLSVLKAYLKGLRSGRAFDRVGEVPEAVDDFSWGDPSLWRGMTKGGQASDEVVEAAGFEPLNRMYHGTYSFIDDALRPASHDMGSHFAIDPMTSVTRGNYSTSDALSDLRDKTGVDTMEELLRHFYDMGKKAPRGKEVAKWFEGKPRPFSHEEWAKYDFGGPGGDLDYMSINPRSLGVDYNIYPFYAKKNLQTLDMPDIGDWHRPRSVLEELRNLEDEGGHFLNLSAPENWGADYFPDALEFYQKYKPELTRLATNPRFTDQFRAATLKDFLKKEGYEGISYPNFTEGMGDLSHLLFDPAKSLRSPYAAFKGESGLMASLLPLVSLLRGEDR